MTAAKMKTNQKVALKKQPAKTNQLMNKIRRKMKKKAMKTMKTMKRRMTTMNHRDHHYYLLPKIKLHYFSPIGNEQEKQKKKVSKIQKNHFEG